MVGVVFLLLIPGDKDIADRNARWVALRLLEGDRSIAEAVHSGELGDLSQTRGIDAATLSSEVGA